MNHHQPDDDDGGDAIMLKCYLKEDVSGFRTYNLHFGRKNRIAWRFKTQPTQFYIFLMWLCDWIWVQALRMCVEWSVFFPQRLDIMSQIPRLQQ